MEVVAFVLRHQKITASQNRFTEAVILFTEAVGKCLSMRYGRQSIEGYARDGRLVGRQVRKTRTG
jgi:hypothetical protein